MSAHLSSEQISRWMAGDRTPDAYRHLRECAECTTEIARLETVLAEFRSSVIEWSALQKGAETPEQWTPSKSRRQFSGSGMMPWRLVAAALAVVLVVLIGNNLRNRHHAAEAFRADVQLWEEVNVQISRPVPVAMEPLVNLIAWESDPGEK